jgi:hypothetical protein
MFIQPKPVNSPTGALTRPKIVEKRIGQNVYKEAQYYDPRSGEFFQKGTISVEYPNGYIEDINGKRKK